MEIKFKELSLNNFKSHKQIVMKYSRRTEIEGDNKKGKTTLKEAIAWILYGTDSLGTKADVQPVTYEAEETDGTITLEVDGNVTTYRRGIVSGKNTFHINEVPTAAKEFNDTVKESIAEKNVFLTLYNPEFFFLLHWTEQRELLLSFTLPPANKEVFKQLQKTESDLLKDLLKKHDIGQLEKIHRENRVKMDKEYISEKSRGNTLKQQLEQIGPLIPAESLHTEIAQYKKEIDSLNEKFSESTKAASTASNLNNKITALTNQIENARINHGKAKKKVIETDCFTCGQTLTEAARALSEEAKAKNVQSIADSTNPIILERKGLREQLAALTFEPVPTDTQERQAELYRKVSEAERELQKNERYNQLSNDISDSTNKEVETRYSLNNSIFVIDSIKEYHAKRSELQAAKIEGLFKTLSIKLFQTVKGTGEVKPTFEIELDGKEYKRLSLSEKIRAGLELRNVISEQSEIIAPVFVDNAESITVIDEPEKGQLITARVVKGSELEIKAEGDETE